MKVERYGKLVVLDEWPGGLRCIECDKLLEDGDRYASKLWGMSGTIAIVEIVCLECALGGPDADR